VTLHYHGTPINPVRLLYELSGRCFCVSHYDPRQVERVHEIGQSVMLDNGAFSQWKSGTATNWTAFYQWCDPWLAFPTTWAVIPDVINGGADVQDDLIAQWPFGKHGAPVWHMDEPIGRLVRLCDAWPKVCVGSTALYADVLSEPWQRQIDAAFDALAQTFGRMPWVHMLRGMACSGLRWPFASVDSTDVARNHNRLQNTPRKLADRWDKIQCPAVWRIPETQEVLL